MSKAKLELNKTESKLFYVVLVIVLLLSISNAYATDRSGWLWPVPASHALSRGYNTKGTTINKHLGIDIVAQDGNEVRAAKAGRVVRVFSGCNNYNAAKSSVKSCKEKGICDPSHGYWSENGTCNDGYGNGVVIQHNDDTYSYYAHMRGDIQVNQDQKVSQGQLLGYVYSSGNSEGSHLHFGIGTTISSTSGIDCNPNSISAKVTLTDNNPYNNPHWKTDYFTETGFVYDVEGVSYSINPEWVTVSALSDCKLTNQTVTFDISSNVAQGEDGCYYDLYIWDIASYYNGSEGMWVGVENGKAQYIFTQSGNYIVKARVHNESVNIYSKPLVVQVDGPTSTFVDIITQHAPTQDNVSISGIFTVDASVGGIMFEAYHDLSDVALYVSPDESVLGKH